MTSFISFILSIAVVGFIVWIILQIPMPAVFRSIIIGLVAFALVLYVLQLGGYPVAFFPIHSHYVR
jgi:hypothetical protein